MRVIRERRREKSPCTVNAIGDADMYRNAYGSTKGIYIRGSSQDFSLSDYFSRGFVAVVESLATYAGIISRR